MAWDFVGVLLKLQNVRCKDKVGKGITFWQGNTLERKSCITTEHQKTATAANNVTWVYVGFRDTAWQKLNMEISWAMRQSSCYNCRPLHGSSNSHVHHNSLIGNTERLTDNNLYCFTDSLNRQWSFIFHLFAQQTKKKRLRTTFPFFNCLYCQLENTVGVSWNISVWKRVPHTRKLFNSTAQKRSSLKPPPIHLASLITRV